MNSYNFSLDSTSTFYVKETTSDNNVVGMDNIADSILQLSSSNDLNHSGTEIVNNNHSGDAGSERESSNEVFVIAISEDNENEESCNLSIPFEKLQENDSQPFTQEVLVDDTIVGSAAQCVKDELSDKESEEKELINECDMKTQSKDLSETQDEDPLYDKNSDKFDMEHFLSFKMSSSAKVSDNDSTKADLIKKHFTECGPNSVMCNVCSDVLLSNLSNLVLHLRHVHKEDISNSNTEKVWKYFTQIESFKSKCNLCENVFIHRSGTTVLMKHLRDLHKKQIEPDFDILKGSPAASANTNSKASSSDVIVIQNSDGRLLNQIKVNKSWKCFTKLPNSDKMICNLCKKIFTHNKTNDLLQHLHEEHQSLLSIKQQTLIKNENILEVKESTDEIINKGSDLCKSVIVQKVGNSNQSGRSAKTNKIWEYFTKLANNKIKCNLCKKVLANNYSTSNLLRHLNARHIEAFNVIKELPSSDTDAIKIVIQNEKGETEKDVSVADMLADYKNMLISNETQEDESFTKFKQSISETWKHYTKLKGVSKVKCNICKVFLSYTEGVSTNLTRHLKSKHGLFSNSNWSNAVKKPSRKVLSVNNKRRKMKAAVSKKRKSAADKSCDNADKLNPMACSTKTDDSANTSVSNFESVTKGSANEEASNDSLKSDTPDSKEKTNVKLRSKAWDYFKRTQSENKVTCNICSKDMHFKRSSTYKLFRHLWVKHKIVCEPHPSPRKEFAFKSDSSNEKSDNMDKKKSFNNSSVNADKSVNALSENDQNKVSTIVVKPNEVTGRTWKHFTKLDREKAKCNICEKIFSYKLGQTSNLIKHIQLQHKGVDDKKVVQSATNKNGKPKQNDDKDDLNKSSAPVGNKPNVTWKYFTKLDDDKVMCNLCEFPNIFNQSKNSRSNLLRHLNRKHKYVLEMSGDDSVFIQTPDIAYMKKNEIDDSSADRDDADYLGSSEIVENDSELQDIKSLFEYLISDEKLKTCIKYENGHIKCKICSGSFVCDNLLNYEYTIRYHVQLFHAEWTVMCYDDKSIKRECVSPVSDHDVTESYSGFEVPAPESAAYNELEAIANEVSSYVNLNDQQNQLLQQKSKNQVSDKNSSQLTDQNSLSDDIWKYFTEMTSQNVRCNFCSILLSFRRHKKWNLIRHLKLKHKSKVNMSMYAKKLNVKKKTNVTLRSSTKFAKNRNSNVSRKSSIKKDPDEKIKNSKSPKTELECDTKDVRKPSESSSAMKKISSSNKSSLKNKREEKSNEKKPIPLASFNSPINHKIGRTWSHFTKVEMGKAQCNICNHVLLYRGTGIDLLNEHLTDKHVSLFNESSKSDVHKSFPKKMNFDDDDCLESNEEPDISPEKKNISLKKDDCDKEDSVDKKQVNEMWQYFTKTTVGYAKCHLCLSELSYKATTSNLMRHLQKIHSVISLLSSVRETTVLAPPDETATEQSKLLAAVDLTPAKSRDKKHVCFIRMNRNTVRCNFCPQILFHKYGNMHKLMSHLLYRHRQEIKQYKSLKNTKFLNSGSEVILTLNEKQEVTSSDVPSSLEQKVDKRRIYRSNTWLYFKKLNEHYAKCNICFNAFSYKGGSIYNLTRHLLIKHDVKLIKRFEIPFNKLNAISKPMPKSVNFSKKKSETLSFYKKISHYVVRCKLCTKRFTYMGTNINHLVKHLWSSHITRLIKTGGSFYSDILPNTDDDEQNEKMETNETAKSCAEGESADASNECDENPDVGSNTNNTLSYFTELNDSESNVKCNICEEVLSGKNEKLSSLSEHLKKIHDIKSVFDMQAMQNDDHDTESPSSEKEKQDNVNETSSDNHQPENQDVNFNQNEIYVYFLKINNSDDKVQCKFCSEVLMRDNLSDLKNHLTLKHDIHDFLATKQANLESSAESTVAPKFSKAVRHKSSATTSDYKKLSKMKCKLCYKELLLKKSNLLNNLIEHLKTFHNQNLTEIEKVTLSDDCSTCPSKGNDCELKNESNKCIDENKKETSDGRIKLECIMFKYFKNLKSFKNKCKVCNNFISTKRPCYHRITNDLSIRYSVCRTKRKIGGAKIKEEKLHTGNEKPDDTNITGKHRALKCTKFDYKKPKIKHFMSVNLHDSNCYECMELWHDGYCIHSLNLWIMNENKNKCYDSKVSSYASNYNNSASINNNDVQIIADSLNGCNENNIIIITDNDDPSVLNYDITNKNESGAQDISYHIMNSINDIDDDDIKVIIYNYNSEDGVDNENNRNAGDNSAKIEEITVESTQRSPNKTFEDHIKSIVNELHNSSQLMFGDKNSVDNDEESLKISSNENVTEEVEVSLNQTDENSSMENATATDNEKVVEELPDSDETYQKSYNLEKLTELAEVSCNEQFYKRNSLFKYRENSQINTSDSEDKDKEVKDKVVCGNSDRCIVEDLYPEGDAVKRSLSIEKEYVASNVVYDDVEDSANETSTLKSLQDTTVDGSTEKDSQSLCTEVTTSKPNEVICEDVINAIFNEVIVNLQESPEEKESNLIALKDGNIEMPPRFFLQRLKNKYKIHKIVLYFSGINYEHRTARCNLCKTYLEFTEPVIYNLLMHLFTRHKDKVCIEVTVNKTLADEDPSSEKIYTPRKKSPVWKYFINEKNSRASCKICRFSFSYKGGAINNLSRHLRLRHDITISAKSTCDPADDLSYMVSYPKRRSAVKLRSKTWTYFSKEPNDWAKCIICKKYLSYRSSTINNLTRHLRTIHSKIFNSLFSEKDPIFLKNKDGTLVENVNFTTNEENTSIYNDFLMESSSTKSRDEILQQCSYSSVDNSSNRRKSIVWNYFAEVTANCGKCNFCSKLISCKGGGTSNLTRHLRSRHGIWIVLASNLSQTFNETMNDPEFSQNLTELNGTGGTDINDTIITQEQLHILKNRKLIHKKSKTWEYFTKESADRVRCNLCSKPLSYKCKAVHNLRRHLAKKHPSCVIKPDPVRLKLQINTENSLLHNTNEIQDSPANDQNKKFIDITDTSVVIVDEETHPPPHRPDRNTRPKKSIVWNYFEELEYGIAKCLICSKILSFRGGGTNNLMRHLRCRHSIIIVSQSNADLNSLDKDTTTVEITDSGAKDDEDVEKNVVVTATDQEETEVVNILINDLNNPGDA